ncbi:hypothetical protein SAMN05519105_4581 [Rhodobacter sp. 24-YEA-8]|nr:hypothetical protein SAMN05519105_4581 [Rhodobacter sp. 24-YEA-8]
MGNGGENGAMKYACRNLRIFEGRCDGLAGPDDIAATVLKFGLRRAMSRLRSA